MKRKMILLVTLLVTLLGPGSVLAHPGHEPGGLPGGFLHPLLGVDHVLALLTIGMWAAGGAVSRTWRPVATFLGFMVTGVLLAVTGVTLPGVDGGIAVSVLVSGLLLLAFVSASAAGSLILIAVSALLHGQAHGLELSGTTAPWLYGLGLLLASTLLLVAGMRCGELLRDGRRRWLLRGAGLLSGCAGAWLLLSA